MERAALQGRREGGARASVEARERPRRNRRSPALRDALRETVVRPANLLLPLFVHEGAEVEAVGSMPGVGRLPVGRPLVEAVEAAREEGVRMVALFPKEPPERKDPAGSEASNEGGLVQRAVRLLKQEHPGVEVHTDVALDPYNSEGHDGVVDSSGRILNDETVGRLRQQALSQARAGSDCVCPSDMMDGRIGVIRDALDEEGFTDVAIMSYCAKYSSSFYGPFRDALGSDISGGGQESSSKPIPATKCTYQMDPGNVEEAQREVDLDEAEGADILMVKPGLPYLDVIRSVRESTALPVAAYQVSGEYSMLKAAGDTGFIDEKACCLEALTALRRAGASIILTYHGVQAARWLNEG
jgi:porphobilinogen synthase